MLSNRPGRRTLVEASIVAVVALGLYLPFLSIQYDTNGMVEASYLEAGQPVNKNHILYRAIGSLLYSALRYAGYVGRSLPVLQTMNAIAGALGIGFAYLVFHEATRERWAAVIGSFWLATSFVYWLFSTDAGYVTLAALLAVASIACLTYAGSSRGFLAAGVCLALSILTWEASVLLIPALLVLVLARRQPASVRHVSLFVAVAVVVAGGVYAVLGLASHAFTSVRGLWIWLTTYSSGGTPLPMWGHWGPGRVGSALFSAFWSMVPIPLAILPSEIRPNIQLGRIAVDVAVIAFVVLLVLATVRLRWKSICFLFGYAVFFPFIVWWDPFEPKWFLVPNIFMAGFLSGGLQTWLHRSRTALLILLCVITIAATNFVTTIRPRHKRLGPARTMAQCVAEHMSSQDLLLASEWGWPDYLGYLHGRNMVNVINETAARSKEGALAFLEESFASTHKTGGRIYMLDPTTYSQSHLGWLEAQTGFSLNDLLAFRGSPAFWCEGRRILEVE